MREGVSVFRSTGARAAAAGLLPLLLYLRTAAPGLTFIDSGELATVATRLGIAHPSGYPLFTLLGWVAAHIPIGSEPIVRLNHLAALLCAGAGSFFFLFFRHLLLYGSVRESRRVDRHVAEGGAFGGAIALALSETFWSQGVAVEVYSLHLLLVSLLLWAFVRALFPPGGRDESRWWSFFALCTGLAFANHMTTILLAPGLLFLYFRRAGMRAAAWKRMLRMAPFFVLGLTPYLYLPLRALAVPLLNWGNPVSLERFLWHVSGKQYRVWIFSSTEAAGRQFDYFLKTLPGEFGSLILPALAVAGLWRLFRHSWDLFWGGVLLFATCVLYSINYDIHDIDSYFLLAYVIIALWGAFGLAQIGELVARRVRNPSRWVWGAAALLAGMVAVLNFPKVDRHEERLVERYTADMFRSFAPGALVLSYQWDYWVSASLYVQYVRGERADVAVVDKELLRRSWYLKELAVRYPWLIEESRPEVDAFLREVERFERDLPYDGGRIQLAFEEMIRAFVRRSAQSRPVYVTFEVEGEFTRGWERVPEGLAYRLYSDTLFHPSDRPDWVVQRSSRGGKLESRVPAFYADAWVARAEYYYTKRGYSEEVKEALRSARVIDDKHAGARRLEGRLGG